MLPKAYQFLVLPFGLNTAPLVFTPLGYTLAGYLHRQGISVSHTSTTGLYTTQAVKFCYQSQLLKSLDMVGFKFNPKSEHRPSSEFPVSRRLLFVPASGESTAPRIQGSGDSTSMQNILLTRSVVSMGFPVHGITYLGFRSYPTGSSSTMTFLFYKSFRPVYTALFRPTCLCQPTSARAEPIFS